MISLVRVIRKNTLRNSLQVVGLSADEYEPWE
jgi:hypothetical protein